MPEKNRPPSIFRAKIIRPLTIFFPLTFFVLFFLFSLATTRAWNTPRKFDMHVSDARSVVLHKSRHREMIVSFENGFFCVPRSFSETEIFGSKMPPIITLDANERKRQNEKYFVLFCFHGLFRFKTCRFFKVTSFDFIIILTDQC